MRLNRIVLFVLAVGLPVLPGSAANWPRFRGPNGEGTAADKDVPITWSDKENILWKVAIPGRGNSSPVIWGDRLYLQSATSKERLLLCVDVNDGKILWQKAAPGKVATTHTKNTLASSTPALDGERIYAAFWDGDRILLIAYSLNGEVVWQRDLGRFQSQHGSGLSPVVHHGKVYVNFDQDGSAVLLAFDARSGAPVWQAERTAFRACYSTPFVLDRPDGGQELVVSSTAGVTGYDLDKGTVNWNFIWRFQKMALRTVGSPVAANGMVFACSGDGSGERNMVALRLGGKGELPEKETLVWKSARFPYVPTLLTHGDHVYSINDKGFAACTEARTGKDVWYKRVSNSDVSASPILIDGKIYVAAEDGAVYVFAADTQFNLLATNTIGEPIFATPAVANGRLFIRGSEHLFCIGKASGAGSSGR
jgi:outer membrane protein assembly factor BamB